MIATNSKIVVRDAITKESLANLEIVSDKVTTTIGSNSITEECNSSGDVINAVYASVSSFHIQAHRQVEVEVSEEDGGNNWRFKAIKLPTVIKVTPNALLRGLSKIPTMDVVALMQHLQAA